LAASYGASTLAAGKKRSWKVTGEEHFLVLDRVHRDRQVPSEFRRALAELIDQGLVERAGRGRVVLSRRFHAFLGRKGTYTRKVGLDRDTNKQLLLKHIRDNRAEGRKMEELMQVLPALGRDQVATLLRQMKAAGLAHPVGRTRAARWFPDRADTKASG
jgi:ATP-dependent DNA helicase RecG